MNFLALLSPLFAPAGALMVTVSQVVPPQTVFAHIMASLGGALLWAANSPLAAKAPKA